MKNTILKTEYTDLNTIYPKKEIKSETYKIDSVILTKDDVKSEKMRSMFSKNYWLTQGLKHNFEYKRLTKIGGEGDNGIMMSDTPMERNSNRDFIHRTNGDVLIFGLGLGLVILPLLQNEDVRSITVVELYDDLIQLVEPYLRKHDPHSKLTIVQDDCFEYHKNIDKSIKFDVVYGDIWISINVDNYEEMKVLTKNWKYRINRNNPDSFIDHWLKDYLVDEIREEKRNWW